MTAVDVPVEIKSAPPNQAQSWPRWANLLSIAILTLGAILRIARWAHWRAFWLDEIYLAQSIVTRGYHDLLFRPLDDWQLAPPGYLIAVRLCANFFGYGERSLRLTSLLLSLIALALFRPVAKRVLGPRGGLCAIGLFAILGPLIYYANELKQYSGDVAASLAIVLVMLRFIERPTPRRAIAAALVGVISLCFSHPAILVLAGTGIAALLQLRRPLRPRDIPADRSVFRRLFLVAAAWLFAFACIYVIFLRPAMTGASHPHLVQYWTDRDAFMPLFPRYAVPWLFRRFWAICAEPGAMWIENPDAAMIAMLLGFIAAAVPIRPDTPSINQQARPDRPRKNRALLVVLAALPIALLASAFKQYPFADRLTLFAVPLLILAMGAGIDFLWRATSGKIAAVIIAAIVIYPSADRALGYLTNPPGREESLGAYRWVAAHWQAGDTLYLSYFAEKSYDYYKPASRWPIDPSINGRVQIQPRFSEGAKAILDNVRQFSGRGRVWTVYIHLDPDEQWLSKAGMDEIGIQQPSMNYFDDGVAVYLYDCRKDSK